MSDLIWVSDWEIECCGSDARVGDDVSWPVAWTPDRAWLQTLLTGDLASQVAGSYASHDEEPHPRVPGVIRRVRTVACRTAPHPPPADPDRHHPVPGTTLVEDVDGIEKWHGCDVEELAFRGWLVDLETTR